MSGSVTPEIAAAYISAQLFAAVEELSAAELELLEEGLLDELELDEGLLEELELDEGLLEELELDEGLLVVLELEEGLLTALEEPSGGRDASASPDDSSSPLSLSTGVSEEVEVQSSVSSDESPESVSEVFTPEVVSEGPSNVEELSKLLCPSLSPHPENKHAAATNAANIINNLRFIVNPSLFLVFVLLLIESHCRRFAASQKISSCFPFFLVCTIHLCLSFHTSCRCIGGNIVLVQIPFPICVLVQIG